MTPIATRSIGIGLVGGGFMGSVHSHAWHNVARYFATGPEPRLVAVTDSRPEAAREVAARFGWADVVPSFAELLVRDDVEVIDICAPNDAHAEIAIAALDAGKHVICEKPLSTTIAEAEAMSEAAGRATAHGIVAAVGYTYRHVPAIAFARRLVAEGRIGTLHQVRAHYLQDWLVDPEFPLVWRLERARAGSGALGDLGAHIVDLAEHLTGERLTGVSALRQTIVPERPQLGADGKTDPILSRGRVTVDDAVIFTARFEGGGIGVFEATRFAGGHQNAIRVELNGTRGSLVFDFDAMNKVQYWGASDEPIASGWRTILVGDPEPAVIKWWPPGHDYAFAAQLAEFLACTETGRNTLPSFADGLHVQRVLDAVLISGEARSAWTEVPR